MSEAVWRHLAIHTSTADNTCTDIQAIILYNSKGHRPQEFGASSSGVEQQATSCALRRPLGAATQLQATFKATTGLHHNLANLC